MYSMVFILYVLIISIYNAFYSAKNTENLQTQGNAEGENYISLGKITFFNCLYRLAQNRCKIMS